MAISQEVERRRGTEEAEEVGDYLKVKNLVCLIDHLVQNMRKSSTIVLDIFFIGLTFQIVRL